MKKPARACEAVRRLLEISLVKLSGLCDFTGLDTAGTNLYSFRAALGQLNANGLQIWTKTPWRSIVCVRNIVSELRPFSADFATFGHDV
jgi:hypothetical protein